MLSPRRNALTVDVEDYFHVSAFEGIIHPDEWDGFDSRVETNTRNVLDLLADFELTGTFFVLGWVAARHPDLVRAIQAAGHEIACHGFGHERILFQTPETFRQDVATAKALLEDITGQPVLGYRAPSYSITPETAWALDVLIEENFAYDSSIFPIIHDLYGFPGASPHPHRILRPSGEILEFPPTTLRLSLLGRSLALPIAGGGYLRLFPEWFVRWGLNRVNCGEGQPCVVYFHPWEIDPGQPRVEAGWKSRFRHYHNLDKTEHRLRHLFHNLAFAPMGSVLAELGPLPEVRLDQPATATRSERLT
jgi:polysaccharide deacetylase family protein (PEP-CTERM system associated)